MFASVNKALFFVFFVQGCAALSDVESAIVKIDSTLPLACEIVTLADPTQAQAVCSVIDSVGNIIADVPPIVSDVSSIALYVQAHPMTPAVKAKRAAKKAEAK